jgi:hypothetical protein
MGLPNIVILSSSRHFLQVLIPAAYVDLCMFVFGIKARSLFTHILLLKVQPGICTLHFGCTGR